MKKRIAKKFWKEFHRLNPGYDFKVKIMPAVPRGSYGWPTLKRAVKRWNTAVALHKRCRCPPQAPRHGQVGGADLHLDPERGHG